MNLTDLPQRPYSIAHRGASAYAPGNTIEAFRKASVLGADMWEVDVRTTSDGQVVAIHDGVLQDGRRVSDLSQKQLNQALPDCPTLDEVLELAVQLDAGIYLDIKDIEACLPGLEALRKHGIKLAILGAFDDRIADMLRGAGCPYPVSVMVPQGVDPFSHSRQADIVHLCWENADRPQDTLTPHLFLKAFAKGQHVAIWHEEDSRRMAAIRTKPVFGICSDRPELVRPMQASASWPVGVVCHRGANKIAPENTLPALECALAAGFSHIEVDVHLTKDNEIVVLHDPTVDRTTNGMGPISSLSLSQARQLDAGSWFSGHFAGIQLPTLDEVIALAQRYDGQIYIESKSVPAKELWKLVVARGMQERCFFWSFNRQFALDLRALAPEARLMARRMDYPSLDAALNDYAANIIEFRHEEDPSEIVALRGSPVASMVCYSGDSHEVFEKIASFRPNLANLDNPFSFRDFLSRKG